MRAAADYPGVLARFSDWLDRLAITDPELAAIRAGLIALFEAGDGRGAIDRDNLNHHLSRSGQERAAARLLRWPKPRPLSEGMDVEAEWLALATREIVLPAIKEELTELRERAAAGDQPAFVRFQALSREARDIEARARDAKQEETQEQASEQASGQADDMVA